MFDFILYLFCIIKVEIYEMIIFLKLLFVIFLGLIIYVENIIIRIYIDVGIYGIGECSFFFIIYGEI